MKNCKGKGSKSCKTYAEKHGQVKCGAKAPKSCKSYAEKHGQAKDCKGR